MWLSNKRANPVACFKSTRIDKKEGVVKILCDDDTFSQQEHVSKVALLKLARI